MLIVTSLLVLIVGLLLYMICGNPGPTPPTTASMKASEVGRIMFFVGLLVLLLGGDNLIAVVGTHIR